VDNLIIIIIRVHLIYTNSGEDGDEDAAVKDPESAELMAEIAYRLMKMTFCLITQGGYGISQR